MLRIFRLLSALNNNNFTYYSDNTLRFKAVDPRKAFLTFLARFPLRSFVSAFGWSLPPHWVFQGFVALDRFLVEMGGGWWAHPPALASLGKMALRASVGFRGPTSSVSRRVVKLTIPHYYSAPLPLQKRGYGDKIQNPVVFMIPSTGSGSGFGGAWHAQCCDFLS